MKIPKVGISQISVMIPKYFIPVEEIAKKRKISPEFAKKGLGVNQARIPYNSSIEKLAAEALRKITYKDVRRFCVGTESDPDVSKPFSVKILNRELGLTVVPFQYKFACLGGLQALISACEYSAANQGRPAIALAVDRSIYRETDIGAEITQGCAAVALRVEKNPKLLSIDYQNLGQYAADIDDFKVPLSSFPFPKINGDLTKAAYLGCQKKALEDWDKNNSGFLNPDREEFSNGVKKIKGKGGTIIDVFNFLIMHAPFPKIVEWAAAVLWRHERLKQKEHLSLTDCVKKPALFKEYKKEIDKVRKLPKFQDFFAQRVKPGLKYNPYIGNPYTSSVFISLIAVLEQAMKNQTIGVSGYGSGASAMCVKGIITMKNGFKSDLSSQLKQGRKLSIEEYEKWRAAITAEYYK